MVAKRSYAAVDSDVLEIGGIDSDQYLSEIDDWPKLKSVVVKPEQAAEIPRKTGKFDQKPIRSTDQKKPRVEQQQQQQQQHIVVHTETRGTQTDRIGPCKCARATHAKNQRRRLDSKKNKQLLDELIKHHAKLE